MVRRILGDEYDACNRKRRVEMRLERRTPEILRKVLLADEKASFWRFRVARKGKRIGADSVNDFPRVRNGALLRGNVQVGARSYYGGWPSLPGPDESARPRCLLEY